MIREYEAGACVNSLCKKHAIGSPTAIEGWIQQYSRSGYCAEVGAEDQAEVQAMKTRMQELAATLVQETPEKHMLKTTLVVVSKALEINPEKIWQGLIMVVSQRRTVSRQATSSWFGISHQAYYQARQP